MQLAIVTNERCAAHDRCPARKKCPTRALFQIESGETAVVDSSLCRGCGDCVAACPEGAIILKQG